MKQVPGIIAYDVDLKSDSATALYDPKKVSLQRIKKAIAEAGYKVGGTEEMTK